MIHIHNKLAVQMSSNGLCLPECSHFITSVPHHCYLVDLKLLAEHNLDDRLRYYYWIAM
jgi:hypothetical protein